MDRISRYILCLLLLALPGFTRQNEDVGAMNQRAAEAVVAKRYDEALALYTKVLGLRPKDKGTAYNLACVHSIKNELDKAHEWLSTACDWGWGAGRGAIFGTNKQVGEIEMCRLDADLENLRKDARFEALLERMQVNADRRAALLKKVEEYSSTPAIYIPPAVESLAEMPLLVVLHEVASNKDAVVNGRWRTVADELGFALLAPSATLPHGSTIEHGLSWFDDYAAYSARPWLAEKRVAEATSAFAKRYPLDRSRVFIAGEGQGALVASSVAVTTPGFYKGALLFDGPFDAQLITGRAPNASRTGLRLSILVSSTALKPYLAQGEELATRLSAWSRALEALGLGSSAVSYVADPKDAAQSVPQIVEAMRLLIADRAGSAEER